MRFEAKEMNELVKYFLRKNISPKTALNIMAFSILSILKLGEPLDKWR
jgi:hypothetical protein